MAECCNRAIVFKETGAWEKVMHLVQLPKPQVRCAGHVLVRVLLRAVHPFDFVLSSDATAAAMHFDMRRLPSQGIVPGVEGGLGIIEEVGEGVRMLKQGQRVHLNILYPYCLDEFQGSWQDYIVVKEEHAIPMPDEIGDEVAAQFSGNPWTVYGFFKENIKDVVPKEEYVLISAAGSVIGRLFIQLARHEGYKTIGIVRRENLKEELLALGAAAVINSTVEDVVERVKKLTNGHGAYVAMDMAGGTLTKSVVASVRDGGEVLLMGEGDVVISQEDFWRKVRISSWTSEPYFKAKDKIKDAMEACMKYFNEGIWKLPPAIKFDLSNFKQALRESKKPSKLGKVLLQSN